MKSKIIILLGFILLLIGCTNHPKYIIDGYVLSDEHFDENGWMDWTDYCRYEYRKEDVHLFIEHDAYKKMTNQDMKRIQGFINNASEWIEWKKDYKEWYHLDKNNMSLDDYYYLEVIDPNDVYGEYHHYELYYFDVSESVLHYICVNN